MFQYFQGDLCECNMVESQIMDRRTRSKQRRIFMNKDFNKLNDSTLEFFMNKRPFNNRTSTLELN